MRTKTTISVLGQRPEMAHEVAAKILEEIYADNKVSEYVDQEWPDDVVKQVETGIRSIINFHVRMSRRNK